VPQGLTGRTAAGDGTGGLPRVVARRGLTLAGRPVTPLPQRTVLQAVFVGTALAAAVPV